MIIRVMFFLIGYHSCKDDAFIKLTERDKVAVDKVPLMGCSEVLFPSRNSMSGNLDFVAPMAQAGPNGAG